MKCRGTELLGKTLAPLRSPADLAGVSLDLVLHAGAPREVQAVDLEEANKLVDIN